MRGSDPDGTAFRPGAVVLASDPFSRRSGSTRPWTVVSNRLHPFHGQQYITMALTTRTWYDDRIPPDEADVETGKPPEPSSMVPHALASLNHGLVTDHIARLRDDPLDAAVEHLRPYLIAPW